jgi:hypothetical protein
MLPGGFEPKISAGERPQTYALDHAATGTGTPHTYTYQTLIQKERVFLEKLINSKLIITCPT